MSIAPSDAVSVIIITLELFDPCHLSYLCTLSHYTRLISRVYHLHGQSVVSWNCHDPGSKYATVSKQSLVTFNHDLMFLNFTVPNNTTGYHAALKRWYVHGFATNYSRIYLCTGLIVHRHRAVANEAFLFCSLEINPVSLHEVHPQDTMYLVGAYMKYTFVTSTVQLQLHFNIPSDVNFDFVTGLHVECRL